MVYYDKLTMPQYNLMCNMIIENITMFKKTLASRVMKLKQNQTYKNRNNVINKLFSNQDNINEFEMSAFDETKGETKGETKMDKKILNVQDFIKQMYDLEEINLNNADVIISKGQKNNWDMPLSKKMFVAQKYIDDNYYFYKSINKWNILLSKK